MASLFIARFPVNPAKRNEFKNAIGRRYRNAIAHGLADEINLLFYGWTRDGNYVAVESYKNEEDLNSVRRASEGFRQGWEDFMAFCDGPVEMEVFNQVDLDADYEHDTKLFDETYPVGESRHHPRSPFPGVFI